MISLRNRAVAGAVFWASAVIAAGSYFIGDYLQQQTLTWFDDQLKVRHSQAVVALANGNGELESLRAQLNNAAYSQPFSGQYWQFEGDDRFYTSASLADQQLTDNTSVGPNLTIVPIAGPTGQTLRSARQEVTLESGATWVVRVASSTDALDRDREALGQKVGLGFVMIGLFGTLGAMMLVIATLRPMTVLRADVNRRWDSETGMRSEDYPLEVRPLVDDINELMARNKDIVDRSRRQSADLAHALKTPAAIMRNELEKLQEQGVEIDASLDAMTRLDAQLQRSLARMRAVKSGAADQSPTDITPVLSRMARAFGALSRSKDRRLDHDIADGLQARIDMHDLEEICGNLLDNALKWSRTQFRFQAHREDGKIVLRISDDGPGIPQAHREAVLAGGLRLDEATPGTGLGLSIASDLVVAYGGSLQIETAEDLGGACLIVTLPA